MENKQRIDIYLVNNQYCTTRTKAQELIKNGMVFVNNIKVEKTNLLIDKNQEIKINDFKFVSRGGYKLEHAINTFGVDFNNKVVLDIGSSTGGFVDCALQYGAKFVFALDVGSNQLDNKLKNNPKICSLENTNLKSINKEMFSKKIDIITCDVSFISLKHVFCAISKIVSEETIMIFLIKPQFELSKEILDKTKGKITFDKHHQLAINNVLNDAKSFHFSLMAMTESPIKGKKMCNTEYLGLFKWKK